MIKEFQNTAIMAGERNISYTQLLDYINLFSKYTPQHEGDKTLIFSENREGWIYAFFSVWCSSNRPTFGCYYRQLFR